MPGSQTIRKLIYDVGAHKGEDTEFYLKKGFNVVAVEAHPNLSGELKERFRSQLEDGSLVLIEGAIAESGGEVDFYLNESISIWGTIRPEWADAYRRLGAPSKRIRLKAIKFSDILHEFGIPYYLKVDIEGADLLCLEALADFPEKPKFVSIESEKQSWEGLLHELGLLQELGYKRFKIIDQRYIDRQIIPNPAREGLYVNHRFEPGYSTGLFGEELPGRWLTLDEALKRYRKIFLEYRLIGDWGILTRNILVRIMRRLPLIRRHFEAPWFDTHATTEH